MARKYEYAPGYYAWNLTKTEEVVFVGRYEEIKPYIGRQEAAGPSTLEDHRSRSARPCRHRREFDFTSLW